MLLTSKPSQNTEKDENVPVIVVRHGIKRKFLSRMASYEDMCRVIRQKFDIEKTADICFQVENLPICKGQPVEVDKSAYGDIAPYLDEIQVDVAQQDARSFSNAGEFLYRFASSSSLMYYAANSGQSISGRSQCEKPQPKDLRPPSHLFSPLPIASPKACVKQELPASGYPDRMNAPVASCSGSNDNTGGEDIIEIDAVTFGSQRPGLSSRANCKNKAEDIIVGEGERKSTSRPRPRRIIPKGKTGDDNDESSSTLGSPRPGSKAILPSGTQSPLLNTASGNDKEPLVQPDGRFKIFISGPKKTHRAEFVTKESHKIKKLLMSACKTFSLDPERSRLESLLDKEDHGGKEDRFFQCDNEETVGKVGIRPRSQLRVVEEIDEADEEEDEEPPSSD
ncbi:hypothetical protein V5O48_009120 [Marasmius crinis-equi]|uniref:Uncharacterized protein n=1 Tax=Marasmius crinis-equi TaxID=585013 RepID=A0ABR3FCB5_9AGAR